MTDHNETMTMLEAEIELGQDIASLHEKLAQSRRVRRATPQSSAALDAAQGAHGTAQAKVTRLGAEKAEGEDLLASLNARLDDGDEAVTVEQTNAASGVIARAARLLKPAEREANAAENRLRPLLADQHLAGLTADALEQITTTPVVVQKTANEAPDVTPLFVVSQAKATTGYGELDASGVVEVTSKGADLDGDALVRQLEDWGSEVTISGGKVHFVKANWKCPRLTAPKVHAVTEVTTWFEEAFIGHVAGAHQLQRLLDLGYSARTVKDGWNGIMKRRAGSLEVTAPGIAIGTARFYAAVQHERGDSRSAIEVMAELEETVNAVGSEAVGMWGEAGEVTSVELIDVEQYTGHGVPWAKGDIPYILGQTAYPVTVEATIRVTYAFEQA